ncbi:MAG: prolipoprotein diacylglyceryl transferase, partial [Paludibacteraceae bacterium]|nr:prolipoprotein diacylglyceryl transferase [Paludibacteraceae bacterium]
MILSTINCQLLTIVWDIDPVLVHIGEGEIRWYGLLWAIGIYLCYLIQVKLYKNENCPAEWTDKLFMWMLIGLIIGARVGHCWFYEWHDVTLPGMKAYC